MAGMGKQVWVRKPGTDSSSNGNGSSCVMQETPGESRFMSAPAGAGPPIALQAVCAGLLISPLVGVCPPQLGSSLVGVLRCCAARFEASEQCACGLRHVCPARCANRERFMMLPLYLGVLVFSYVIHSRSDDAG